MNTAAVVVDEILQVLERTYGLFEAGMREFYRAQMTIANLDALPDGVIKAMRRTGRRCPTVEEILAGVREEAGERWERQKHEAPTLRQAAEAEQHVKNRPLARETFALMEQCLSGALSAADQAAAFWEMDRQFPGIGWDVAAQDAARRAMTRKGG